MAKHGVLMERDNFIASKAMNRAGISALAIDGGAPVVEGAIQSGNDELYALTAYATGGTRVGIAFNPSAPRDEFGYPVRSMDDRTYYNRIENWLSSHLFFHILLLVSRKRKVIIIFLEDVFFQLFCQF